MNATYPNRVSLLARITLATLLAAVGLSLAGPLDPPAGPIVPTNKTLTEVEPRTVINATNTPGTATCTYRITAPGSYYLTGNLIGVAGKNGIEVAASGVTIDLNGFEVSGPATGAASDGILVVVGGFINVAILNGSVRNWIGDGIDLFTNASTNARIEGVRASSNGGNGMSLSIATIVSHCTGRSNGQHGILANSDCTITGCTLFANTGSGINCSSVCTISNCSAYQNSTGISASGGCTITCCTAQNNTTNGISTGPGCLIEGNAARANAIDGINCSNSCNIRGNACDINGNGGDGANIHVTGLENRIEGNNCTGADRGIEVGGTRNIIMKNTCAANTNNWLIAVGNSIAPIVVAGVNGAIVTGNSFGGSFSTTDPSSNFTY